MPGERLSMRKIRELLRLRWEQRLPQRVIGRSLRLSQAAVSEYLSRARRADLTWPLPDNLDDARLEALLFPPAPNVPTEQRPVPDWAKLAKVPPAKQVECQMRAWCTASCGGRT